MILVTFMLALCSLQDSDPCSRWEPRAVAAFPWLSALVGWVPPGSAAYHRAEVLVLSVADLSYKEKPIAVLRKRK